MLGHKKALSLSELLSRLDPYIYMKKNSWSMRLIEYQEMQDFTDHLKRILGIPNMIMIANLTPSLMHILLWGDQLLRFPFILIKYEIV